MQSQLYYCYRLFMVVNACSGEESYNGYLILPGIADIQILQILKCVYAYQYCSYLVITNFMACCWLALMYAF